MVQGVGQSPTRGEPGALELPRFWDGIWAQLHFGEGNNKIDITQGAPPLSQTTSTLGRDESTAPCAQGSGKEGRGAARAHPVLWVPSPQGDFAPPEPSCEHRDGDGGWSALQRMLSIPPKGQEGSVPGCRSTPKLLGWRQRPAVSILQHPEPDLSRKTAAERGAGGGIGVLSCPGRGLRNAVRCR